MADLLVKIMLEKIHDYATSGELQNQFCIPPEIRDILLNQPKRLFDDIYAFNKSCKDKKWEKRDYCRFDNLFIQLGILRKELFSSSGGCEEFFQNCGDYARATNNPFCEPTQQSYKYLTILAKEANNIIKYVLNKDDEKTNKRHYFIISSFRNPAEVQFFRKRYGSFYLCSLFASKETRRKKIPGFNERCDERDAGKHKEPYELHKQDVSRCTLLADYAITTEKNEKHYQYELIRFLALIDFPGLVPPRTDEEVMNLSYWFFRVFRG